MFKAWCPHLECRRGFGTHAGLGRHFHANPAHRPATPVGPVVRHPTRVTCKQKCAILDDLRKLEDAGVPFPQKSLRSKHPKYSKQTISDWSRDRDRYYREVAKGRGHARHIQSGSRAHFPPEENVLYMRFVWRRQIEGFKTGDLWLRLEMADLLAASRPVGWTKFACSPGWL